MIKKELEARKNDEEVDTREALRCSQVIDVMGVPKHSGWNRIDAC